MQDVSTEALFSNLDRQLGATSLAARFARILYAGADEVALRAIDGARLAEDAAAATEFIGEKPAGLHKIRVRQCAAGTASARTVVEMLNDDMPFIVDSILAEVQTRSLPVALVLHPIFTAERDASGRLIACAGPAASGLRGGRAESFVAVHLAPISDAASADLGETLGRILSRVRVSVADWPAMLARVGQAITALDRAKAPIESELKVESLAFLRWLEAGNFTFLGMRELRLAGSPETGDLAAVEGSGLGALRDPAVEVLRRGTEFAPMTPEVRRFFFSPSPLIITKSNVISTVHRRAHMDYIGAKIYGGDGQPCGELRIVGLFTSRAYTQSPRDIPFLRHKVASVRAGLGYPPASHAGKALDNVLDTFPRDELFQIGAERLQQWCVGILDLDLRPRVRVFVRRDRFDRFASLLIYVPRDRYTTAVRERIGALLSETYGGRVSAFYPYFPEGPLVRVQFIIARGEGEAPEVTDGELEARIADACRTFDDRLAIGLAGLDQGSLEHAAAYAGAFPASYADTYPATRALADIQRMARLSATEPVAIAFHREAGQAATRVQATVYRLGEPMRLSERVPLLENLGFSVIDERTFLLTPRIGGQARAVALHDMELETADGHAVDLDALATPLEQAFLAVLGGAAENDPFNRLIASAGLGWRDAGLLRAYAAYLRQVGAPFGPRYIAETLRLHSGLTRDLMELFLIRFDPDRAQDGDARAAAAAPVRARIDGALAAVPSLDDDRILRQVLALFEATLRTNFFQLDREGRAPATIAFKLASRTLDLVPEPRPACEIFVASPRVEGVHLRFAAVARGGIRWSDRAQDFRTEVLGLVKAQLVKNAVIVPSGSKGGFLPKLLPRNGSRNEIQQEGIAAYRIFISALLDLTDNIVDGRTVPPARVVRYDGDDPYLVVAADKGTATFSDIANEMSAAHGFWLGDAFASGGSAGYDHKQMAITARGAWECVKRHFREMDRDIQKEPFRVAGVGDMSGDVFGNGMLQSPMIRLVAAFDHRDIFLDPDPDPAVSFAERRRLFELPRSSWQDYDRAKISAGGGVFSRAAKSVPLSQQARAMLGLTAEAVAPAELMRAILGSETDLLWFGGIGTYVRGSAETDEQAGDRANDAIRVTGAGLRAKVIGEGANLGMTQRGRVEFAERGGRLNTDFIDNSAGVNCSDQEVNIKIAVGAALTSGRLALSARNELLATMTSDVAAAVLVNNYQQGQALSLAERTSARDSAYLVRLMQALEVRKLLNRALEALPSNGQLAERVKAGRPLTRPELAVLLSFAKIALTEDLLASEVPDQAFARGFLDDYFPPALRRDFVAEIATHRLRREIIATGITNLLVNRGGASLAVRLADETGRSTADVATALLAADRVHGVEGLWHGIDALDGRISGGQQLDLYLNLQEFLAGQTLWFLRDGAVLADYDSAVAAHSASRAALMARRAEVLPAGAMQAEAQAASRLASAGVPAGLARSLAALDFAALAPDITRLAGDNGGDVVACGRVLTAVGDYFRIGDIGARARALAASDYFDRLAIAQAGAQLAAARQGLAGRVLRSGRAGTAEPIKWLEAQGARFARTRETLDAIARADGLTVSRLTVAAQQLRDLAEG